MKELKALCDAIKNGVYKSKQATFNHFIEDFCTAKDLYGWQKVVDFINKETGVILNIETYRSMLKRARKARKTSVTHEIQTLEQQKINTLTAESNKPKNIGHKDYLKYLNACFNNKIIAQQAIENGISVETIKSWSCANFVQVGTAIGNHIRYKRK